MVLSPEWTCGVFWAPLNDLNNVMISKSARSFGNWWTPDLAHEPKLASSSFPVWCYSRLALSRSLGCGHPGVSIRKKTYLCALPLDPLLDPHSHHSLGGLSRIAPAPSGLLQKANLGPLACVPSTPGNSHPPGMAWNQGPLAQVPVTLWWGLSPESPVGSGSSYALLGTVLSLGVLSHETRFPHSLTGLSREQFFSKTLISGSASAEHDQGMRSFQGESIYDTE